jgi:hypothetical protein
MAARTLKIPFVVSGGLGDAHGFLAGLGAGADAIMMGSRFMATVECPISDRLKQNMVDLTPEHPELRHRCLADPDPKVYTELFALRDKMPLTEWIKRLEKVGLKESDWKAENLPGDFSKEWVQYFGEMVSMCVEKPVNKPEDLKGVMKPIWRAFQKDPKLVEKWGKEEYPITEEAQ